MKRELRACHSHGYFPLTPTLSPGERECRCCSLEKANPQLTEVLLLQVLFEKGDGCFFSFFGIGSFEAVAGAFKGH